tara:strand:+ start:18 stop:698 length:681 start_codon:yes stop_codon:yes gene_type:complete
MIDKRMMYALGQRVAKTLDGSRPGYRGDDAYGSSSQSNQATSSRAATSSTNSSAPGGDSGRETRGDGPVGPVDMSHFGDTGDIVQADFTPYNERPDTITRFGDNYNAQLKSMGLKNLIPGAQIYNIGKTALQTAKVREMLGLTPAVGPGSTDGGGGGGGGDGQGITAMYNPYILPGEVEDETINTGDGDTEFVNRFELSPEARQAQGIAALLEDKAIAEMISKLYT